jgi:hypothetical protein
MRDLNDIKKDLGYGPYFLTRFILHAIACDLVAEVERLHTANRLLLEERAAVRKSLGEHFIAIADEDGNPTDSAYYMDQGVGMLATQWQFSQDQLERAHQELAEAKAEVERLRGRVGEWRSVEDTWDEWHFEGACEGAWVAGCVGDEDTPEDCGYIYCPTCGGKIVFIGGDDDCEEEAGDE